MTLSLLLLPFCLLSQKDPAGTGSPEPVDLLRLIDPSRDAVKGAWKMTDTGLVSPGQSFSRIVVPYVPPEEYDLTLVVERHGSSNSVNLGLAAGNVQFMVILDAYVNSTYMSGLELIDGKGFYGNETTLKEPLFKKGIPTTVVCSVRKDRVTVSVGARKIIDWKADYKRLSLFSGWAVPHKNCLLLGSWTSVVRWGKLELRPVRGTGRLLKRELPPRVLTHVLTEKEIREKVSKLIDKLDSRLIADRETAHHELGSLPVRLLPLVQEYARKKKSAEVTFRVGSLSVPDPWPEILEGSIREAGDTVSLLEGRGSGREKALGDALAGLALLSPDRARPILKAFLASDNPSLVNLALEGHAFHPPEDLRSMVDLLKQDSTAKGAAGVLIAAGDASLNAPLLKILTAGSGEAADQAGRVLEHLGPGKDFSPLMNLLSDAKKKALHPRAVAILARSGTREAEAILLDLLARKHPLSPTIAHELAFFANEEALPNLRRYHRDREDAPSEERVRQAFRDREWAREALAEARTDPDRKLHLVSVPRLAAAGGSALREETLRWLKDPKTRISEKKNLLPLLGAVGRRDDGPLLVKHLSDDRLADAAGEALEMLGDPTLARSVMEAFLRTEYSLNLRSAVCSLPVEAVEDDLAELISDQEGYGSKATLAFRLAEKKMTPRLRKLLLNGLLGGGVGWTSSRGEALRILTKTMTPEDLPKLARIRNHAKATEQATGLLLAVRCGDPDAPRELAGLLSREEFIFIPYRGEARELGRMRLMEWAAPAGDAWRRAVKAQWKAKPGWQEGALWLAGEGDPDALAYVRTRITVYSEPLRRELLTKLCEKGDPLGLHGMIDVVLRGRPITRRETEAFLKGADRDARGRVIAHAWGRQHRKGQPIVRLAADLADPRAVGLYRRILVSDGSPTRSSSAGDPSTPAAMRSLAKLKGAEVRPLLRRFLRSAAPRDRAAAAEVLAELGDRRSVPWLVRLVDDPFKVPSVYTERWQVGPVRRVWHAAMEALRILTKVKPEGASTAERRAFWRSWYAENENDWR